MNGQNTELRKRNVDTFLDNKDIDPADVWQLEIEQSVKKEGGYY